MATTTLPQLRARIISEYGIGRSGTNTGTSASQITDATTMKGHGAAEGVDVGCAVQMTSGARVGSVSRLSGRPVLATGVFTVSPDFSGALASGETYDALYYPFDFDG